MSKNFAICSCALVLLASLSLAGCGPSPLACTDVGCQDQFDLEFVDGDGDTIESFEGELAFDGDTINFECSPHSDSETVDDLQCVDGGLRLYDSPDEVELSVTSDAGEASPTLSPDYEEVQPNGEGCPPTCRQASATVTLE